MGYKNKKSLILLVKEKLDSKLAINSSKQQAKANGTYRDHIYSWGTYRTYLQQCCQFVKWCKQQARQDGSRQPKTLEDCKQYVVRYMQHLQQQEYSAYTQKLVLSALCKLYSEYPTEGRPFGLPDQQPARHRADITRSRNAAERDLHFSEKNNADIVTFCRCTGLRRAELAQIRGIDLDGNSLMVYRGTKGGRVRIVPVCCGSVEEMETVKRLASAANNNKIFDHISSAMDVHHYRSVYCQRLYDQYARPIDQIPQCDRYYCRQDKKGVIYDKRAMLQVSRALGHNRISVIAGHYLQHKE